MANLALIFFHLVSVGVVTVTVGLSTTRVIRTTTNYLSTTEYYLSTPVIRTTVPITEPTKTTTVSVVRTINVVSTTTTTKPTTDAPLTSVATTSTTSKVASTTTSTLPSSVAANSSITTSTSPTTSTTQSLPSNSTPSNSTPTSTPTATSTSTPTSTTASTTASTQTPAPSTSTPAVSDDHCPPAYTLTWYWIGYFVPDPGSPTSNYTVDVDTVQSCQEACLSSTAVGRCKSFVFSPGERMCTLYDFRFNQPGITFNKSRTNYYFQWQCKNYTLPGCLSTEELAVYRYLDQTYFDPGADNQERITVSSEDQCEQACVNTWSTEDACQSYNYDRTNGGSCVLNRLTSGEGSLSPSENQVFVERTCFKDPGICSSRNRDNRVWYAFTNRTYPREPDIGDVISGVTSYVGCQNLCFYEENRTCKAVVYRPKTQECLLYRKSYEQNSEVGDEVYYYECAEKNVKLCSTNNELIWVEFKGRMLTNHRDEVLHDVSTVKECQERCMDFSHWLCRSVEYDELTKTCTLSGVNRKLRSDLIEEAKNGKNGVSYYEWLCKLETCFSEQKKVYFETRRKILKYHDDLVYEDITTLHECLTRCSNLTAFTCRSLEYSDNTMTCRLSEATAAEADPEEFTDDNEQEYRYVEWRCRRYNQNRCHQEDGAILYWSEAQQSRLNGGYILSSSNIHSQSKCEEMCFNTSQCESVQYKLETTYCEINNYNTDFKQLISSDSFNYLEWRCAKPEYEPCLADEEVYWQAFVGRKYRNPSSLTITKPNVSTSIACEHLCLKAKQDSLINCESVQYHLDNRTCFLFSGTARRDQLEPDSVSYQYLERHCRKVNFDRCTPGTSFRVDVSLQKRALLSDPHGEVHNVSSLTECQDLCEKYKYFECVSIDYSTTEGKCVLHAVGQLDGFHVNVSTSYDYYEMKCIVPVKPISSGVESLRLSLFLSWFLYILSWFIGKSRVH